MSATGFLDACGFTPASAGTGDFVVSAAIVGYQTPAAAGAVNGAVYSYRAESPDKLQWEEGFGAHNTGTTTQARTTVTASSTGAKVAFSAAPNVFVTALSADLQNAALLTGGTLPAPRVASILRSYLAGLTLSTAGSSSTFGVAVGVAADSTNADVMALASAYTKTTAAWAVGTGNGALDTGAIAASTWYHVYLMKRPDTGVVDVCVSLNASLSAAVGAIPGNYTLFRRIGSMKTNGSSQWLKFSQNGNEFLWDATVTDVNGVTTQGTTPVNYTLSVPTGVTVNVLAHFFAQNTSAASFLLMYSPVGAAQSPSANWQLAMQIASSFIGVDVNIRTNTSAQVAVVATAATGNTIFVTTVGYVDTRGREA